MEIVTYILNAAKVAKVSGVLLLALCSHESGGFKHNYAAHDNGSPSYGSCQIKKLTAEFLGFKGDPMLLNKPKINSHYAALYLKYQQSRYGDDWVKLVASYNSGSYMEGKVPNCPRNLRYLKLVQKKLPLDLREKLNCGTSGELAGNE